MLHHLLLGVARECDAAAIVEATEQHLNLDQGEILHLVDGYVSKIQRLLALLSQRADPQLPRPQEQCVVLGVEIGVALGVALQPGEELLVSAPTPLGEIPDVGFVDFLLRTDQLDTAAKWLEQLDSVASGSFPVFSLRLRLMVRQEEASQLDSFVAKYVRQRQQYSDRPAVDQRLHRQVAELLESLGQNSLAERWFERLDTAGLYIGEKLICADCLTEYAWDNLSVFDYEDRIWRSEGYEEFVCDHCGKQRGGRFDPKLNLRSEE